MKGRWKKKIRGILISKDLALSFLTKISHVLCVVLDIVGFVLVFLCFWPFLIIKQFCCSEAPCLQ